LIFQKMPEISGTSASASGGAFGRLPDLSKSCKPSYKTVLTDGIETFNNLAASVTEPVCKIACST
jgi:hypothetical protein